MVQQQIILDHAYDAAVRGDSREEALDVMQRVAEGVGRERIEEVAARAGLISYVDKTQSFDDVRTRCYALDRIGATDLPDALNYLRNFIQENGTRDGQVYSAAEFALEKGKFRLEKSSGQQIAFLEMEMTGRGGSAAAVWAAEELCNRGSAQSLPKVTEFKRRLYPGQSGDEIIGFCSARVEVLSRSNDKATALGTVLHAGAPFGDRKIVDWVVTQLFEMHSADADVILDRYASDVEQRFPDLRSATSDFETTMHRGLAQRIRQGLSQRSHNLPGTKR